MHPTKIIRDLMNKEDYVGRSFVMKLLNDELPAMAIIFTPTITAIKIPTRNRGSYRNESQGFINNTGSCSINVVNYWVSKFLAESEPVVDAESALRRRGDDDEDDGTGGYQQNKMFKDLIFLLQQSQICSQPSELTFSTLRLSQYPHMNSGLDGSTIPEAMINVSNSVTSLGVELT
ncbi:hypothetical protein Glove_309g100 [Diversispora epigaea]|uniref:Uncharacterized protein n=1 Tax=Diversispora epigaea TaxID=1348612 RepID=A0A397HSA6_9GLOM|nr:hypothetical protein Glove_309g100 [Diversispora epigaea]